MKRATIKPDNFNKAIEITQDADEKSALFLSQFSHNLCHFTNLDLDWVEGKSVLAMNFISQSAPDIWCKLQKFDKAPGIPVSELVDVAFKIVSDGYGEQRKAKIK
jgi:hypothetical protein